MILFIVLSLLGTVSPAPAPFEIPLSSLRAYFAENDDDAKANPIPYDKYGAPPDHFPAIIPDMPVSDYYEDNNTYPGMWMEDDRECHSVSNCPGDPSDRYAPIFPMGDYPGFLFSPQKDEGTWECKVEADCFGQDRIPNDLSNDTEVLIMRSFNFTALNMGDFDVLPPLSKLRIEYSDLKTIEPGVFSTQPMLQTLELVGNSITSLESATFLELAELTTLDLTSNRIAEINRANFEGLDALTELRLVSNSLTQLEDDTFRDTPNLEKLFVEYNNITTISRYAFRGLSKLRTLYLNHNRLSEVPGLVLREPPALSHIYFTGNPLHKILRKDFKGVERLQELWLDDCEIESIAKNTFQGSQLQILVIANNRLTNLPNLGKMKQLRRVVMDYNPWICDCSMIRTVKWLKRNGIGSDSEQPACAAPEHLAGRRAIELSNDDLCAPPPYVTLRTNSQPTVPVSSEKTPEFQPRSDIKHGDEEDYGENPVMPEGGWSKVVYNPNEMFTTVELGGTASPRDLPNQPQSTIAERSTTMVKIQENTDDKATQVSHEENTTDETAISGDVELTSRDTGLEKATTTITLIRVSQQHTTPKPEGRPTKAVLSDIRPTSSPTETTSKSREIKPSGTAGTAYSAIAVIGATLLVAVVGVFVFRLFISKHADEKAECNSNNVIELTTTNGNMPTDQQKPQIDQNGNSSAKPATTTEENEEGEDEKEEVEQEEDGEDEDEDTEEVKQEEEAREAAAAEETHSDDDDDVTEEIGT